MFEFITENIDFLGQLIIPIFALIISTIAILKSSQAIVETQRPEIDVVGLSIDRSKLEVFVGTASVIPPDKTKDLYELKKELKENYAKLINEGNCESNMVFKRNNESHWVINFIPKGTDARTIEKSAIIGFNALEVELEFTKKSIREIQIKNGYTLINKKSVIPSNTKQNAKFLLNQEQSKSGKLTIPFTYVSLFHHDKDILLRRALILTEDDRNEAQKEMTKDTIKLPNGEIALINILTSKNPIHWLGFEETGYILKLITTNNDAYEYSFIITAEEDVCNTYPVSNESVFFKQRVKEIRGSEFLAKKKIVQGKTLRWRFWRI